LGVEVGILSVRISCRYGSDEITVGIVAAVSINPFLRSRVNHVWKVFRDIPFWRHHSFAVNPLCWHSLIRRMRSSSVAIGLIMADHLLCLPFYRFFLFLPIRDYL
jgi:hypothetical protein